MPKGPVRYHRFHGVAAAVTLTAFAGGSIVRRIRKSQIIRLAANDHSVTSISFAHSALVPASVFAETGRISSTSCAFFSTATDFPN